MILLRSNRSAMIPAMALHAIIANVSSIVKMPTWSGLSLMDMTSETVPKYVIVFAVLSK